MSSFCSPAALLFFSTRVTENLARLAEMRRCRVVLVVSAALSAFGKVLDRGTIPKRILLHVKRMRVSVPVLMYPCKLVKIPRHQVRPKGDRRETHWAEACPPYPQP